MLCLGWVGFILPCYILYYCMMCCTCYVVLCGVVWIIYCIGTNVCSVVWCDVLRCCVVLTCYIVCCVVLCCGMMCCVVTLYVLCCGMKCVVLCCVVLLWYDVFCCVGYDVLCCGVVWYGVVWCGMCYVLYCGTCCVWYGMVWYDVICRCVVLYYGVSTTLVLPVEFTVRYYRILSNPTILHVYNRRFLVDSFAHQNQPSFVDILSFL